MKSWKYCACLLPSVPLASASVPCQMIICLIINCMCMAKEENGTYFPCTLTPLKISRNNFFFSDTRCSLNCVKLQNMQFCRLTKIYCKGNKTSVMNILNLMRHLCYLPHKSNAFNSKLDLWLLLRKD